MGKMKKVIAEKTASVRSCQAELSEAAKHASPEKKSAARRSIMDKLKENRRGDPQDASPELTHA